MSLAEPDGSTEVTTNKQERTRTGNSVDALKRAILDNLFYVQGRFADVATKNDWYLALAYTVRDRMLHRWIATAKTYKQTQARTVCYFSAEFLLGPHLGVNLINLEIWDNARAALSELGLDLAELLDQETEPGLGNGGLGRLATSIHWPRSRSRPSVMAFATSSGSSISASRTAGRWRSRTSGCCTATPGSLRVPN